jgi:hypothetical protein
MQQYAVYILLQYHSTCFGYRPHPSSGVRKTVVTATGTSHMFVQLPHTNLAKLVWDSCTSIWLAPVAVTTVLCTPDDGCGRHRKHVERSCSKINYRLHIVASRWTFINTLFSELVGKYIKAWILGSLFPALAVLLLFQYIST